MYFGKIIFIANYYCKPRELVLRHGVRYLPQVTDAVIQTFNFSRELLVLLYKQLEYKILIKYVYVLYQETNHNEYAVDEDEDSTDTDEYEDRRRVLDIPAPSGRCPHHT